jgi:hypothetical protein
VPVAISADATQAATATKFNRAPVPRIEAQFWKARVFIIGIATPLLILAIFGLYLLSQWSASRYRSRIHANRLHADQLAASGKYLLAYRAYDDLLQSVENSRFIDSEVREDLNAAMQSRDRIKTQAVAQRDEDIKALEEAEYQILEREEEELYKQLSESSDRLSLNPSEKVLATHKRNLARVNEINIKLNNRYRIPLNIAAEYFKEDAETIGLDARGSCKRLRKEGIRADVESFLWGAIYLMKNTHYPNRTYGRPTFRSYASQYHDLRKESGMTHNQAISDLYERRKF